MASEITWEFESESNQRNSNIRGQHGGDSFVIEPKGPRTNETHRHKRFHFIRDMLESGDIILNYIESRENVADTFTKPLPRNMFEYLRDSMNLK